MKVYTNNAISDDTDDGILIDLEFQKVIFEDDDEMRKMLQYIEVSILEAYMTDVVFDLEMIKQYSKKGRK